MHRQQIHTHTHTHTGNCKCNSNKFSSISVFGLCLLSAFSHFLRSSSWKSAALTTVAVFKYLHDFRLLAQLSFKMAVSHTHTHTHERALALSLANMDTQTYTNFRSTLLSALIDIDNGHALFFATADFHNLLLQIWQNAPKAK